MQGRYLRDAPSTAMAIVGALAVPAVLAVGVPVPRASMFKASSGGRPALEGG